MSELLTKMRTVSQRNMQKPLVGGGLFGDRSYLRKARVRVRPARTYYISEEELNRTSHNCKCTIVWNADKGIGSTMGWRELKFINRTCPYHADVECVFESL